MGRAAHEALDLVDHAADREVTTFECIDQLAILEQEGRIVRGNGIPFFEERLEFRLAHEFRQHARIAENDRFGCHDDYCSHFRLVTKVTRL